MTKRSTVLLLLAGFLIFRMFASTTTYAEVQIIMSTVKQSFGGSQSPDDARVAAFTKAKREALEKAGTYLESLTIVKNAAIEKDEILSLSAGLLKAEIVSQKNYLDGEAFGIMITAKVNVDQSLLEKSVKKLLDNKKYLNELNEIRQREAKLLTEVDALKKKNEQLQRQKPSSETENKRKELKAEFQKNTQALQALDWYQKAMSLRVAKEGVDVTTIINRDETTGMDKYREWNNPEKALYFFNRTIELDPFYAKAYNYRGNIFAEIGKYDEALQDYNQAINMEPNYSRSYNNRSIIWLKKGIYDQAISDCTKAIQINSKYAPAYINRGNVWLFKEDYDRAISDYTKAIELEPIFFDGYAARGNAWLHKGNYDRAIADCTKAIGIHSQCDLAYNTRGVAYFYKDKDDQAIADYTKAIELNPQYALAYCNRGEAWLYKEKYDRAISDCTKAIKIKPDNALAYNIRGEAWIAQNKSDYGCRDLQKSCDLEFIESCDLLKKYCP